MGTKLSADLFLFWILMNLKYHLLSTLKGSVPDRGGRANEMRPKALSSGGNSGRGGGGGGGGRGRGGGGGGGGGRGNHQNAGRGGGRNKSSDSNKRQQGDHGKQGGRESKVSKTTPVGATAGVKADVSADHS